MKEEGSVLLFLGVIVLLVSSALAVTGDVIHGKATEGDVDVSINVVGAILFTIHSPENTTYVFEITETVFPISLNVSNQTEVDSWWYDLEDLDSSTMINESVIFTPNTTIFASLGSNKLTVYANNSGGAEISHSVTFTVSYENSAPVINPIPNDIFFCEASYAQYTFTFNDSDADPLTIDISPKDPFFVFPTTYSGSTSGQASIFSTLLDKTDAGNSPYSEILSVTDGVYVAHAYTNITVIEINNAPSVETLGAKSVWLQGENTTFYEVVSVSDVESGNENSGNLYFNLSFPQGVTPFFNISSAGIMNYTASEDQILSGNSTVYNLTLCVTDEALAPGDVHPNITLCGQTGGERSSCQNFSLTVTTSNRPPRIVTYSPASLNLSASGTDSIVFEIEKSDPDDTIPTTYWYIDGSWSATDISGSPDSLTHSFGCGVDGEHTVSAVVSDGSESDSVQWNVSVSYSECPVLSPDTGGGGGGGGGPTCSELWGCRDWYECKNVDIGLASGELSGEEYRAIISECDSSAWERDVCGYQIRECSDANSCNSTYRKPAEAQSCLYVFNPGCSDGVKNCHDGLCEVLVDCGGPCGACPTCSDGLQNQGEEGVDCGGPCSLDCALERPAPPLGSLIWRFLIGEISFEEFRGEITKGRNIVVLLSLLVFLIMVAVFVIRIYGIFKLRRERKMGDNIVS